MPRYLSTGFHIPGTWRRSSSTVCRIYSQGTVQGIYRNDKTGGREIIRKHTLSSAPSMRQDICKESAIPYTADKQGYRHCTSSSVLGTTHTPTALGDYNEEPHRRVGEESQLWHWKAAASCPDWRHWVPIRGSSVQDGGHFPVWREGSQSAPPGSCGLQKGLAKAYRCSNWCCWTWGGWRAHPWCSYRGGYRTGWVATGADRVTARWTEGGGPSKPYYRSRSVKQRC